MRTIAASEMRWILRYLETAQVAENVDVARVYIRMVHQFFQEKCVHAVEIAPEEREMVDA
jgi:hypothetical protein